MGVFTRFKRGPEGFRALVELWESTPVERRQRMIDIGREEDPHFTEKALQYLMTFDDILKMPDPELAEVIATAPGRIIAMAVRELPDETKKKFLQCSLPAAREEIKTYLEMKVGLREIGGAQLKLVEYARKLEKEGKIKTKRIPR